MENNESADVDRAKVEHSQSSAGERQSEIDRQHQNQNIWPFQQLNLSTVLPAISKWKTSSRSKQLQKSDEEHKKRMKEYDDKIAAEKAQTEVIKDVCKEENEKAEAQLERQNRNTERQLKTKEDNEKQQQLMQQKENGRKMKAAEAEQHHQQKLKEIEEQRINDIQALEAEMELIERKTKERKAKTENDKVRYREQSEARMALAAEAGMALQKQVKSEQLKIQDKQKSKVWEATFDAKLKSVQNEYQKEIENRRAQECSRIEALKRENEKQKALTNTLSELQHSFAAKPQKMNGIKITSAKPQPNILQQSIKIVENKLIGSSDIVIIEGESSIGVIGLPKTGRSFLIGALAGGIWPKDLSQANPTITKNGEALYKLNYPNNGFVNGSIDENQTIYDHFFQSSNLSKLSLLILTIDGAVREEDYLILCLAKQYNISTVIVRTKLDEWLDNLPKGHSKEEYVETDKKFVIRSLKELNFDFPKENIYNLSSLAMIRISEEGPESEMKEYQQDEKALIKKLQQLQNSSNLLIPKNSADILILGLKNAGKSAIANALQKLEIVDGGKSIEEMSYNEMDCCDEIIKKIEGEDAKLNLIIVPNTVGNLDAKIASYLVQTNKNVVILLNKSDEMIDNLKKQRTFISIENYVEQRHNAANWDLTKLNITNIPIFTVSALRLDGTLDESYSTEDENFIEFLKQNF